MSVVYITWSPAKRRIEWERPSIQDVRTVARAAAWDGLGTFQQLYHGLRSVKRITERERLVWAPIF